MALEIFRLDGRVAQEPLKDNNTLDTPKYTAIENTEMKRGEAVSIAPKKKEFIHFVSFSVILERKDEMLILVENSTYSTKESIVIGLITTSSVGS